VGSHHRIALCLALCACQRSETAPQASPSASSPAAPDTAQPHEIAEGSQDAFGLMLPRDMLVTARMKDAVYASGKLAFEPLANYVRERVLAQRVDTGPNKTVFVNAAVKSAPERVVDIEVVGRQGSVQMVVRDRRRAPAEKGPSEEQRWKRVGLTPDGRVLKEHAK
jgi:hypothetical protein